MAEVPARSEAQDDTVDPGIRQVLDSIPAMVWMASPDGAGTYVNRAWTEYLGLSLEDTLGFGWTRTVHPDDLERYLDAWRVSLRTGAPLEQEVRYRRSADGQYRWFLARGVPVRDAHGRIVRWYGIGADIEDRKRAEEAAHRVQVELRAVVETIPALLWTASPQGTVDFVNQRWQDFTGLPAADAFGWNWETVIHPDDLERVLSQWRAALDDGRALTTEVRIRQAQGQYRLFLVRAVPLRDQAGQIVKWVGISTDIEDRRRAEEGLRQSQFYLSETERLTHTGSWAGNRDSNIRYWSTECYRVLGFDPQHGLPTYADFFSRIHADDRPHFAEIVDKANRDKADWDAEYRVVHPDGRIRDIYAIGHPVLDASGNLVEFVGTVVDVTERKQAEKALRLSEKELRDLIENMPAMALALLPDGSHIYLTKQWTDYTGLSLSETDYEGWARMVHPDDVERHVNTWRSCAEMGQPFEGEARFRRADGKYRWFLVRATPLRDETSRVVKWHGILTDIEDRKQAEEALRRSEEQLKESQSYLTEAQRLTHTGSWANTPSADRVLYWSEEMFRILGLDPAEGPPPHELFWKTILHPDDREDLWQRRQKALREKSDYSSSFRIIKSDGTLRYLDGIAHPVLDSEGKITKFVGSTVDVTDRKRAEEALRRSQSYLAQAERLSQTGSWAWDPRQDQIVYCSDEIFRIYGFDPRKGIPTVSDFLSRIHPDDRARVRQESLHGVQANDAHALEYRLVLPDGTLRFIRSTRYPIRDRSGEVQEVVGTAIDLTERTRAAQVLAEVQRELAHANRLATMGQLTASIAHEVNQPLAVVLTNTRVALGWLDRGPPGIEEVQQALSRISDAGHRAADVIARVRAFVKKAPPQRDQLEINEAIREVVEIARPEAAKKGTAVETHLAAGLPLIEGDRVQLQQVLLNLLVNALDAMSSVKVEARQLLVTSETTDTGDVLVAIRDSGPGLDPATIDRIFDAFFTTKPGGLGMGLVVCRSIIEAHNGRLWAEQNVPCGAVFRFTVPAARHCPR